MSNLLFASKWAKIKAKAHTPEESSVFVDIGEEPVTQRQLNLYNYFLFIKNVLKTTHVDTVLEMGCGRGTTGLYIAKYLAKKVSLLDDSGDAIDIAKKQFAAHNLAASYYVRNALHTDIPDGSFDCVVSIGLAEHFGDINPLFAEKFRILKKGGVMISLNIPRKFSLYSWNIAMRSVKKLLGSYKGDIQQDYYRNAYAPEIYAIAAKRAGFQNITITHVAPFPLFVPVSVATDKKITAIYKTALAVRGWFQKYPYQTNRFFSLAHFLVGYKR